MVLGSFTLTLLPAWTQEESNSPDSSSATPPAGPAGTAATTLSVLYGFLVDTEKCVGAGKCLTACRVENQVPEGYSRTWVERFVHFKDGTVQVDLVPESGYYGSTVPDIDESLVEKAYFVPKLCNQCVDAPCNQVCPVHASFTSPEGVELVDGDRCIGCGYCVQACPYGVRFINPETNNADKCTWCYHRITNNESPACVEACPVGARVFGRLDDPNSELSQRLAAVRTHVLKEHLGTHPKLHYVGLSGEVI
jgi:Fe-S-cluster-containing dehydrogenase component